MNVCACFKFNYYNYSMVSNPANFMNALASNMKMPSSNTKLVVIEAIEIYFTHFCPTNVVFLQSQSHISANDILLLRLIFCFRRTQKS